MTLVEFLTAMLERDEAVALDAAGWGLSGRARSPGRWHRDGVNSVVDIDQRLVVYGDGPSPGEAEAEHIVRWDPARALREVEAKRRILERHNPCDDWSYGDASTCPELCLLALPYADHRDYCQEWKP